MQKMIHRKVTIGKKVISKWSGGAKRSSSMGECMPHINEALMGSLGSPPTPQKKVRKRMKQRLCFVSPEELDTGNQSGHRDQRLAQNFKIGSNPAGALAQKDPRRAIWNLVLNV